MAIILRITSADGSQVVEKELPRLPAKVKLPPGGRASVIDTETGVATSLAAYINKHTVEDNSQEPAYVVVETVEDWPAAVQWLTAIGTPGLPGYTAEGVAIEPDPEPEDEGGFLGSGGTPLLLGGSLLLGGGAAALAGGGGSSGNGGPAPAAPTGLDLSADFDTGFSDEDNLTSVDEALLITGSAEAGSSVSILSGGSTVGSGTADADGNFAIEVDLAEGTQELTAVASNGSGNDSAPSEALTIEVDLTPPEAPTDLDLLNEDDLGHSLNDGVTNVSAGLTFAGNATLESTVLLFNQNGEVLGSGLPNENGIFEFDIALEEGTHAISARALDDAGNLSDPSDPVVITVDTTTPEPPSQPDLAAEDDDGVSDSDNETTQTTGLTFSGTADPNSIVIFFNGGVEIGNTDADENGDYTADFDLDPNVYLIRTQALDVAGNLSDFSVALEMTVLSIA